MNWDRENELQRERVQEIKNQRQRQKYKKRPRIPKAVRVDMLKRVAQGQTQAEIAEALGLAKRTVETYTTKALTKFREESALAIRQGLEAVRSTTHENVVTAAGIVNTVLKAKKNQIDKDKTIAEDMPVSELKDYSSIAEKEFNKLNRIDNPEGDGGKSGKRHSTNVNIVNLLNEIKGSDIVSADDVFEVDPQLTGEAEDEIVSE